MQPVTRLWKSGCLGKVVIGVGGLLLCGLLTLLLPRQPQTASQPGAKAGPTDAPAVAQVPAATAVPAAPKPTEAPKDTATPRPTNTPAPTNTPRPTNTPVIGQSREAPAPKGQSVVTKSGWSINVTEFIANANQLVERGNMFNPKPEAGQKYVALRVDGSYQGTAETSKLIPGQFRLVGTKGTLYPPTFAAMDGLVPPEGVEVFKGGKAGGLILYKVSADDSGFQTIINTSIGEGIYLAVE